MWQVHGSTPRLVNAPKTLTGDLLIFKILRLSQGRGHY